MNRPEPLVPVSADPLLPAPLLVVEDERAMQLRLRSILNKLHYTDDTLLFAGSNASACRLVAEQAFAMALIDVGLPDGSGIDLIRALHLRDAALPILVISAWSSEQVILEALAAGAGGYLLKERDDIELELSIRSFLRGGAPIDPFMAKRILQVLGPPRTSPQREADRNSNRVLTSRETEILNLVSKGLANREIADTLALSKLTVECHIRNIYKKLSVGSRTEAVFEARSYGYLP